MDLLDIALGVYLALVLHSLTMAWLTADGTRSVTDGVRYIMHPEEWQAARENFDWYVEQERRIRERDWAEQRYYQQQEKEQEWASLRGAQEAAWSAGQTAWGDTCTTNPMLPPEGAQYTPMPHGSAAPQSTHLPSLPPVPGTLQNPTPVPTTGLPTSSQPMLQPLDVPFDDDDGYGAILAPPSS